MNFCGDNDYRFCIALKVIKAICVICEICGLKTNRECFLQPAGDPTVIGSACDSVPMAGRGQ